MDSTDYQVEINGYSINVLSMCMRQQDTSDASKRYEANLGSIRTPVERQILSVLVTNELVL